MHKSFLIVRGDTFVALSSTTHKLDKEVQNRFMEWAKFLGLATIAKSYNIQAYTDPLFPNDWQDDETANQPEGYPRGYDQWAKNTF